VQPTLVQDEAVHSLALGLARRFAQKDWRPKPENGDLLATVWTDDGALDLAAWHTPPFPVSVSYTHLRPHETVLDLVCRLLL